MINLVKKDIVRDTIRVGLTGKDAPFTFVEVFAIETLGYDGRHR